MPATERAAILCAGCQTPLAPGDRVCPRCGLVLPIAAESPAPIAPSPPSPPGHWLDNRFNILTLIWCVIGPFAIPLLWRSRAFTIREKIVHSLGIIALAAAIVCGLWYSYTHFPTREQFRAVFG